LVSDFDGDLQPGNEQGEFLPDREQCLYLGQLQSLVNREVVIFKQVDRLYFISRVVPHVHVGPTH